MVSRYHTHVHRALELKPATMLKLLEETDAFRRPERFAEFLSACECDARGRVGLEERPYPQADYLRARLCGRGSAWRLPKPRGRAWPAPAIGDKLRAQAARRDHAH